MANWTEERVRQLTELWASGFSAAQIAMRFGDLSRNAVLGKVHRLGLSSRRTCVSMKSVRAGGGGVVASPRCMHLHPWRKRAFVKPVLVHSAEKRSAELAEPDMLRVKLLDLTRTMCRWPLGDPRAADFAFCGGKQVEGCSYCAQHAAEAYRPG